MQQYLRQQKKLIKIFSQVSQIMGSDLSQSQQLKNTFPLSQFKVLPIDPYFPNLTLLQRTSDASTLAVSVLDKQMEKYRIPHSNHFIQLIDKKQIGRKHFELYQWTNANVHGLCQYISTVDQNRSISKSQFNAILEGAVRAYSCLNNQAIQIDCLDINMRNLRIFNQISLKVKKSHSKEISNSIIVKLVPKNIQKIIQSPPKSSKCWVNIGSCIHNGGILTEKELLAEYLVQISNIAVKKNSYNRTESLKNLKQYYGNKAYQVIQGLLSNQDWKQILKNLDKIDQKQTTIIKKKESPVNQLKNHLKIQSQKTIDTQKDKSSKQLIQFTRQKQYQTATNLKNDDKLNKMIMNPRIQSAKQQKSVNWQTIRQPKIKVRQTQNTNRITRVKSQKYFSPPSTKVIREITPRKVFVQEEKIDMDSFKLSPANKILTIIPQILRQQSNPSYRVLSTKVIQQHVYSPQGQGKRAATYILSSPRIKNQPQIYSPRDQKQNQSKGQKTLDDVPKKKGKPINFKLSEPNKTLKPFCFPEYTIKIKPDIIQSKKTDPSTSLDFNSNKNFLSQDFKELNFELAEKFFKSPIKNKQKSPPHKA